MSSKEFEKSSYVWGLSGFDSKVQDIYIFKKLDISDADNHWTMFWYTVL